MRLAQCRQEDALTLHHRSSCLRPRGLRLRLCLCMVSPLRTCKMVTAAPLLAFCAFAKSLRACKRSRRFISASRSSSRSMSFIAVTMTVEVWSGVASSRNICHGPKDASDNCRTNARSEAIWGQHAPRCGSGSLAIANSNWSKAVLIRSKIRTSHLNGYDFVWAPTMAYLVRRPAVNAKQGRPTLP